MIGCQKKIIGIIKDSELRSYVTDKFAIVDSICMFVFIELPGNRIICEIFKIHTFYQHNIDNYNVIAYIIPT